MTVVSTTNRLAGINHIDRYFADRTCEWLGSDDDLLFHTLLAVSWALHQGHTCLSLEAWANQTHWADEEHPGYTFPELGEWANHLLQFDMRVYDKSPVVLEMNRVYLRRYHQFEVELTEAISARANHMESFGAATAQQTLDLLFPDVGEVDWQKLAAANTLLSPLSVVIGGPGTGKTRTVTRILALLLQATAPGATILMGAPTGKAAQRLGESIKAEKVKLKGTLTPELLAQIPDEATTLHRLLGTIPKSVNFRHNETNPIEADILLLDEVSMVDLPLMARLFRAVPDRCRIIMLGDSDQLPSVAAGSVLAELAAKGAGYTKQRLDALKSLGVPVPNGLSGERNYLSQLKKSYRFEATSGIGQVARRVMDGDGQAAFDLFSGDLSDLEWIEGTDVDGQVDQWTREHFLPIGQSNTLEEAYARLQYFRILTPNRVGPRGVLALNKRITKQLNPMDKPFYKGQPVMVTENNHSAKLSNGDIGLIWPNEDGTLLAWFQTEDGFRPIAPGRLPLHETVYAMTIHKTQGSEFDHVSVVLPETASQILSRELVFTGITRARKNLTVLGSSEIWNRACRTQVERHSGLSHRLKLKQILEG